jgi:hypothetical protein
MSGGVLAEDVVKLKNWRNMKIGTILGAWGLTLLTLVSYLENGILPALIWLTGGMLTLTVAYRISRRAHEQEN